MLHFLFSQRLGIGKIYCSSSSECCMQLSVVSGVRKRETTVCGYEWSFEADFLMFLTSEVTKFLCSIGTVLHVWELRFN